MAKPIYPRSVTAAPPIGAGSFARVKAALAAHAGRDPYRAMLAAMMALQISYMVLDFNMSAATRVQGNPLTRLIKILLIVLSLTVLSSRSPQVRAVLASLNRWFLRFVILVLLSILWSIDRGATIERFVSLVSMVLVCLAFTVAGWHARRLQNCLRPILTLILLASLVAGAIDPTLVLEAGDTISLKDAWHGLTQQKNIFGSIASLGFIFWLHAWLAKESKLLPALIGMGISGICLVFSKSSTAAFATVFVIMLLFLLMRSPRALRRYMPFIATSFAAITVAYGLAMLNIVPGLGHLLDPVVALTGKDRTFSARSQIWEIIVDHIHQSPLLGTGYGAYWTAPIPRSPSYIFISRMYGFWPGEAHNGYLDIMNDLGWVGLICLFGYLIVYLRQSLDVLKFDRDQAALLLALLFQQIIENLSGSSWLSVNSFAFVVMTAATFALARYLHEARQAAVVAGAGAHAPAPRRRR
jgi:O-antigen ligase